MVLLSTLSHVREPGPLLLEVVAWAVNHIYSSICVSIDSMSFHAASNNQSCVWCLSIALPPLSSVKLGVAESSKSRKHVLLLCVPPGNSSRYVRGQIINFIQILTVLCHGCYSTHLIANTFEPIVVHLTSNHLWCHETKTKHLFNCTIDGTIIIHHYCIWFEFVITL